MSIKTVLFGFLGCGGLATMAFLWTRFSGKGALEKAHGIFQKKKQETISKIEAEQKTLKVSIDKKEDLAEDTRQKIQKIQKDAAKSIAEVLKEDKITKLNKEIEEEWENI